MTDADWRILAGIAIVLAVATYSKYVLAWSTKDFIIAMIREFRDLMTGKYTPGGINAAVLVGLFVLTAAFAFIPKFEKILSLGGAIPSSSPSSAVLIGACLMFVIGGLICVSLVRSGR